MDDQIFQSINNQFDSALGKASGGIGEDPEEAARALKLEGMTGVNAGAIYGDDGYYDRAVKRQVAQAITAGNPIIQEYLSKHPMHPIISNDDHHNLDKVTEDWNKVKASAERPWDHVIENAAGRAMGEGAANILTFLGTLTNSDTLRAMAPKLKDFVNGNIELTEAEQQSLWGNVGQMLGPIALAAPAMALGGPFIGGGLAFGAMGAGAQIEAAEKAGADRDTQRAAAAAGFASNAVLGALPFKYLSDLTGGVIKQTLKSGTAMGVLGEFQTWVDSLIATSLYDPTAEYKFDPTRTAAAVMVGGFFGGTHALFFKSGKAPPVGSNDVIDDFYKRQADENKKNLQELLGNPSQTKARSMDAFRAYLGLHPDATVRVTADGLRTLYGPEEKPTPGDGKLGDMPSVVDGFDAAAATNSHVSMSLADFITKVPETLHEDLLDHLILSERGISVDQAKKLPKAKPPPTLEAIEGAEHEFAIKDETGNVGRIKLVPEGDNLKVEEITAEPGKKLGYKGVREIKRRLAEEYPDAKTMQGFRISGLKGRDIGDWAKLALFKTREEIREAEPPYTQSNLDTIVQEIVSMYGLDRIQVVEPKEDVKVPIKRPKPKAEEAKPEVEETEEGDEIGAETEEGEIIGEEPEEPEPGIEERIGASRIRKAFTKKDWDKLQSAAAKEDEANADFIARINERAIRLRRTEDWKKRAKEIRKEAERAVDARPDVAADSLLRAGILMGVKLDRRPRIHPDDLTAQQQKDLAATGFVSERNGLSTDTIASMVGYESGDAMVTDLIAAEKLRVSRGISGTEWYKKVVDAVTEDRLQKEFGTEEKLLQDIQEHLVSPQISNRVHEEVVALGMEAGVADPRIKGKDLDEWIKHTFDKAPAKDNTVDRWLDTAAKAGRDAEVAIRDGKAIEAYKAKQAQYIALKMANYAHAVERATQGIEKIFERFRSREVANFPIDHKNFIQDVMFRLNDAPMRLRDDLAKEIAKSGYKNIDEFVKDRMDSGSLMDPAAWLLGDAEITKDWRGLSSEKVVDLHDSLKDLVADGVNENKVLVGGKFTDKALQLAELITTMRNRAEVETEFKQKNMSFPRTIGAGGFGLHALFNKIARGDVNNSFLRLLVLPSYEAFGFKQRMENAASKAADAARAKYGITPKWLAKKVSNDIFKHNLTGKPITLTRNDLIGAGQYFGDAGAWEKLTKGWGVDPKIAEAWFLSNIQPHELEFLKEISSIFKEHKEHNDAMMRSQGFTPAQDVPLRPFEAHGKQYDGWYVPVRRHERFKYAYGQESPRMAPEDRVASNALFDDQYKRATPNARFQKTRTQDMRPVDMTFTGSLDTIGSMIRDTAYRPYLLQLQKFFYDPKFRAELGERFGKEWVKELDPYLKALVNQENRMPANDSRLHQASEWLRSTMVATEIFWKTTTLMKHVPALGINSITDVGGKAWATELKNMMWKDGRLTNENYRFAMENSNVLASRARNLSSMAGFKRSLGDFGTFRNWMDTLMDVGSYPLAWGDKVTAVPQWLAVYKEAMERIGTPEAHAQAVLEADRAVVRAHGSGMETNLPRWLRNQGTLSKWVTSFYAMFSHFFDRNYETAWRMADEFHRAGGAMSQAYSEKDLTLLKKGFDAGEWGKIATLIISYNLIPIAIGMAVDGELFEDDDEDFAGKIIKSGLSESAGMVPVLRDVVRAAVHGRDLSTGLMDSVFGRVVGHPLADAKSIWKNGLTEKNTQKSVEDLARLIGTVAILPPDQFVNYGKFLYNLNEEKEYIDEGMNPFRPHTLPFGLIHGTAKGPTERSRHH